MKQPINIPLQYHHTQHLGHGILYAIISALSFAIMSVFVKMIGTHLPTAIPIFFRFAVSLILLLPWVIHSSKFRFKVTQPLRYLIRILSALLALFLMFYALKFIPLMNALLLNNTAPLFVPVIVYFLTGAKTSYKTWLGILIGFAGIVLILHPNRQIFSSPASLIALASGIFAAVAIVQMRLVSKTNSVIQMLFYYFLVSTLISGIVAIGQWQTPLPQVWWLLLDVGVFGALYQIFATLAYVTAPVRLVSPLMFFMVIFGGLSDWVIWGHVPSAMTLIGTGIIVAGSIITIYFGKSWAAK
jgi:drug/metabolite transporter (DMT)-like permease